MTIHKVAIGKFPLNAIMQAIQPDIRLQQVTKLGILFLMLIYFSYFPKRAIGVWLPVTF